jgi:hypothetical protein
VNFCSPDWILKGHFGHDDDKLKFIGHMCGNNSILEGPLASNHLPFTIYHLRFTIYDLRFANDEQSTWSAVTVSDSV